MGWITAYFAFKLIVGIIGLGFFIALLFFMFGDH